MRHFLVVFALMLLAAPASAGSGPFGRTFAPASAPPWPPATGAGGTWTGLAAPSPRLQHALALDSARDRLVLFGGWDGAWRNDVWVLDLAGPGEWRQLAATGTAPPPRAESAAIFDEAGDRLVVFGGLDGSGPLGDAWALSLGADPAWIPLSPAGAAPTPRFGHSAVYDAVRNRMLVFGGDDEGPALLDESWALSLGASPAWALVPTGGTAPAGRAGHSAILDAPGQRMIVFGGQDGVTTLGDAHALDLAANRWSALSPAGEPPAARTGHVAALDPSGARMIVHGGWDGVFPRADTWSVNLAGSPEWTPLAPGGAAPSARSGHAAAFDGPRARLLVFGGDDGARRNDAHALALEPAPQWSVLAAPYSPTARYREGAVLDPLGRVVVFGGYDGSLPYPAALACLAPGAGAWSTLPTAGPAPSGRYGHTMTWDPLARRAVIFGGFDGTTAVSDPWALTLDSLPAWLPLAPAGAGPSGRQNHTTVRDARRNRLLVFGGFDGARRNDTWSLGLGPAPAWEPLSPAGVPPSPRSNHCAIYDPVRDRVIVFGGSDGVFRNDVWELALAGAPEWKPVAALGVPPSARVGHAAIYDPLRDRMVVFGGDDLGFRDDAWELSLAGTPGWTALAPAGAVPPGRRFHAALYDPRRDAMWVHGGWNGDYRGDAAALGWGTPTRPFAAGPGPLAGAAGSAVPATFTLGHALAGPRAIEWTLSVEREWPGFPLHGVVVAGPPAPETLHVVLALPDSAAPGTQALRLSVAFVGAESWDSLATHALTVLPGGTAVAPAAGGPFAIEALGPNPARGPIALVLRAPRDGLAVVEWFDVGGRRVGGARTLEVRAGTQWLPLEPPGGAVPGLHLVRACLGHDSAVARVVVLR